jgi:hypothetical protein
MSIRTRLVVAALAVAAVTGRAGAQVPSPTIEGPITSPGGAFIGSPANIDFASVGYEQAEYFISGTANAYTNTGPLGVDGMWSVAPSGTTAAYKTRILVYRPTNAKKFSGTVFVEWLNVSGGVDANPDWTQGHVEMVRQGAAWVGVSAQFVGVEGGPALVGVISLPLKAVNAPRYGSLHHPGDSFSYDMFSQAGQAVLTPSGPNPLGTLKPKRVIAIGESQSAFRLTNYVNAIHPLARVYDGYLVHSRGSFGTPLSEAPQPAIAAPGTTLIRADVDVPVLTFETETDLTFLRYFDARQDDSKHFRLWEVAGTAHYDTYGLVNGATDLGTSPDIVAPLETTEAVGGIIHCNHPINSGPQHFVVNGALNALVRWVRSGKAPKSAPRLDASVVGSSVVIATDANGNALGGIRTPQVDVPVATFTGEQDGSILCRLFGTTTLFDDAQLASLYPSHKGFTKAYAKSLKRAVKAGWILKPDAKLIKQWAAAAPIGS